jgi:hypothetical protein
MSYIIAIVIVIALGVGFTLFQNKSAEAPTVAPVAQEVPVPTTPTEPAAAASATDYTDGTYATDVTYFTPKRDEYGVNVSLTLMKDIVTDAKVTYSNGGEKDPNAARFEAAYKAEVIGKDIDTLNLSRVGGASLTTAAFNNALVNIKADAKS